MVTASKANPMIGKVYPAKSSALVAIKLAFCAMAVFAITMSVTVSIGAILRSEVRTNAGEETALKKAEREEAFVSYSVLS